MRGDAASHGKRGRRSHRRDHPALTSCESSDDSRPADGGLDDWDSIVEFGFKGRVEVGGSNRHGCKAVTVGKGDSKSGAN